jgi:large subunit ribosomal protein L24
MKIKKNDTVLVIAGNSKGKKGRVLKIFRDTNRVIVEGVNIVKRHSKPTQKVPQGGIMQKESSIDASNVMIIDPKTSEATRVGGVLLKDDTTGKKRKMRIGVKSKEMFE